MVTLGPVIVSGLLSSSGSSRVPTSLYALEELGYPHTGSAPLTMSKQLVLSSEPKTFQMHLTFNTYSIKIPIIPQQWHFHSQEG